MSGLSVVRVVIALSCGTLNVEVKIAQLMV